MNVDRDQSEFNMSVSYLNRLNTLLYAANEFHITMDSYHWFITLNTLFVELSSEMKPNERDQYICVGGKIEYINNLLLRQKRMHTSNVLYFELMKYQQFLKNIIKKSGLEVKYTDDPRRALT